MASKSTASPVVLLLAMVLMLAVTSQAQAPAPTRAPAPAPAPSQLRCPSIFNNIRDLERKAKELEHQFFFAYIPGILPSSVNSTIPRLQSQHPNRKVCVCFPYLAIFAARNIRCLGASPSSA